MGDDTMSILFFGTYDVRSHPRVAVLRDGLRAHGAQVEECNAPLGLSTADRVSLLRKPWTLPLLAWRLASCWTSLARGSKPWRRPGHRPDAVVVGYLGHFDVLLARRLFRGVPIVLDHLIGASSTAADRGVDGGLRQRLLRSLDAAALASADLVVVDTDEHLQALPEAHRGRAITVLVGAPATWSAAGGTHDHTTANPLRVVFFGLFTPLQGAPTIGAAIGALAQHDIEFTMIGTGQDLDATRQAAAANPHVRWIDWVDADALPAEVAAHDVCLGIFGTTPKALKVVPNKVYQGAAAGCAVVTSDTDPQRRVLGDAAMLVP
ncbi:MAG: glycosyltransferase, partial [Actinomycetota bacterium]